MKRISANDHPLPWRVEYYRRCPSWHEKSSPYIVDAVDNLVCELPQTRGVNHPGFYDLLADETAQQIVAAVNLTNLFHGV